MTERFRGNKSGRECQELWTADETVDSIFTDGYRERGQEGVGSQNEADPLPIAIITLAANTTTVVMMILAIGKRPKYHTSRRMDCCKYHRPCYNQIRR